MSQVKYFFCYAREDSEFVLKLANDLREAGVELWLDQLDMLGGQRWDRAIEEALAACGGILVVMSPDSMASNNVMDEVSYALEEKKLVVPILLRPTSIPFRLRRLHHIDFSSGFDGGFTQLLKALQVKQPSVAPKETPKQQRKQSLDRVELPTTLDEQGARVLPVALGIETLGGVFTKLIPEHTPLPLRRTEIFSTASDNQTSVEVSVFAGVRPLTKDNVSIGKFHLVGIPPAQRGIPQIEVAFEIDTNGVVNVSAKDLGSGREQVITIASSVSQSDIAAMLRDAESYRTQDATRIEEVEARNRLDGLLYQMEKTLKENQHKVSTELVSEVEAAMADSKKAMSEGGVDRLNKAFNRLQNSSNNLARAIYQTVGGDTPSTGKK